MLRIATTMDVNYAEHLVARPEARGLRPAFLNDRRNVATGRIREDDHFSRLDVGCSSESFSPDIRLTCHGLCEDNRLSPSAVLVCFSSGYNGRVLSRMAARRCLGNGAEQMIPNSSVRVRRINPCRCRSALDLHRLIFSVFSGPLAELRGWSGTEGAVGVVISAVHSLIPMIPTGKLVHLARCAAMVGRDHVWPGFGSGLARSQPGFVYPISLDTTD
jgi:hypothetical protein